jgi:ribosomal protein S18 acetylase RimI-like enzyme
MDIPMNIAIRSAQHGDRDAMVALLDALFSIEADFTVDKERQHRGLTLLLDGCRKHAGIKVAVVDGNVVGMGTVQTLISTAEGGLVAMVEDMVVAAPYRKMGIGRMLMSAIEKWARDRGVTRLHLLADRANLSALEFYDRIGWQSTQLICLRRKWDL